MAKQQLKTSERDLAAAGIVVALALSHRAGALPVGRAQLVDVLEDRPELDAVTAHQPHCAFDGIETVQRGELVEQEQYRPGRTQARANLVRACAPKCDRAEEVEDEAEGASRRRAAPTWGWHG